MKRLIIDDIREFHFPDGENVTARTTDTALFYLINEKWDEVWWDHDMGYTDGKDTHHLANLLESDPLTVRGIGLNVVHTANPVEAPKLVQALSRHWPVRLASLREVIFRGFTLEEQAKIPEYMDD